MVWCRKGGPSYIRKRDDRSVRHGLLSVPLCCEVSVSLPLIQQNDQLARKVTAEGINLKLGASDKPKIAVKNDIILDFQRRHSINCCKVPHGQSHLGTEQTMSRSSDISEQPLLPFKAVKPGHEDIERCHQGHVTTEAVK